MSELPLYAMDSESAGGDAQAPIALCAEDVHVEYTVYEDRRVALGQLVRQRFHRRTLRTVKAVKGVSLQFREGETIGIVGPNGSGKSTLLRAMCGLIAPSQGEVRASSMPVLLGVSAALNPELSGRRNVVLGGTAMGLGRREVNARMDSILQFAGLEDYADMPVRAYSSGMRSRLQFSIAASVEPEILLIDEALAVGDQEFRRRSGERMKELSSAASLVVLVSHSMGSIREVCDRVIWLRDGRVADDGPAAEVLARYQES